MRSNDLPRWRLGLRDADVRQAAALLRGGASWAQVAAAVAPDADPETLAAWRPEIERLSREPGPAAALPRRPGPEERERGLRAWLDQPGRRRGAGVTVVRSLGPPRRS